MRSIALLNKQIFISILAFPILFLGIFVFSQNRRSLINMTFSLKCLCVFVWLFGYFMMYSTRNAGFALWCSKFVYTGVVFIPTFFYHFTVSFLGKEGERKKTVAFVYLNGISFCILLLGTDKLVAGLHDYYWGYHNSGDWIFLFQYRRKLTFYFVCLVDLLRFFYLIKRVINT